MRDEDIAFELAFLISRYHAAGNNGVASFGLALAGRAFAASQDKGLEDG
jgi:hypothetical protein